MIDCERDNENGDGARDELVLPRATEFKRTLFLCQIDRVQSA